MKPTKPQTLDQIVATLDRATLVQCLAYVQRRRARDEILQRLLEARLTSMTSSNGHAHRDQAEWLTVKDVARELRLTRAYAYELVRSGELPSVRIPGEKGYVRVPRDALTAFIKQNAQKTPGPWEG
jgi:excisionase family DNA binding protein